MKKHHHITIVDGYFNTAKLGIFGGASVIQCVLECVVFLCLLLYYLLCPVVADMCHE